VGDLEKKGIDKINNEIDSFLEYIDGYISYLDSRIEFHRTLPVDTNAVRFNDGKIDAFTQAKIAIESRMKDFIRNKSDA
jgi:hypothetical protein